MEESVQEVGNTNFWENVYNEWDCDNTCEGDVDAMTKGLFSKYLQIISSSVQHRCAVFQIEDALQRVARTQKEYHELFWGCIKKYIENNSETDKDGMLDSLQLPEEESVDFPIELKGIKYSISVKFGSNPVVFQDGKFPASSMERHITLQNLFSGKLSAIVVPLQKTVESVVITNLKKTATFDTHFGGYNEQTKNFHLNEMKEGDFYVTRHTNKYYHIVIHTYFENGVFDFADKENEKTFFGNLIFFCHSQKVDSLHFLMDGALSEDVAKNMVTESFTNIRQAMINDEFTTISEIEFICSEEAIEQKVLKEHFILTIHPQ
ncbi:hypothetical protein EIN_222930 [Entamoeba invadens IP1]|uniref:Uncharacterized protein n=1 Tax=Entamoeba invadens IP1 TaxID=370355 RepID=A0A0A1U5J6_ENTIV|nr:hypothetical protein EIN_222930 [Entamoeba invadens IP1]ELP88120.1 hypothetical protein EIN_222930 [Entamoeba invadens IP1]|eukprot:XP_004254891.1 hypothetical protein EIN_222930 [Entamoeba invadens IP1]